MCRWNGAQCAAHPCVAAISSASSLTTEGQPGPRPGSRAEGRSLGGPAHRLVPHPLAPPLAGRAQGPGPGHFDPPAAPLFARSFVLVFSESPRCARLGLSGEQSPTPRRRPHRAEWHDPAGLTWRKQRTAYPHVGRQVPEPGAGEGGAQAKMGSAEWLTPSGGSLEEDGLEL